MKKLAGPETILCTYQIPQGKFAGTKQCGLTAELESRSEISRTLTFYRFKCPLDHNTRVEVDRE